MTFYILGPNDPALNVLASFLESHPEMDMKLVIIPWENYPGAFFESLKAPESPYQAVFIPGHVWLADLVEDNSIIPIPLSKISSEIVVEYNLDDLIPKIREECSYKGELYLIPWFTDGHILFYRNDYINLECNHQKIPTICSKDLEALVKKVHNPPHFFGLALKAAPSEIFLDWLPFLWDFGGDIFDHELKPCIATEESILALETYCHLRNYCAADTHKFGNQEIANILRAKKVGIAPTWGGQAGLIFPHGNELQTIYSTALYSTPWNATWGIGIPNKQPSHVKTQITEALLRIAQPEIDTQIIESAGSPVRISSYSEQNVERYFWLKAQWEMLLRCRTLPSIPNLGSVLGVLYPAVYSAFIGEKSPKEALSEAQARLEKLV